MVTVKIGKGSQKKVKIDLVKDNCKLKIFRFSCGRIIQSEFNFLKYKIKKTILFHGRSVQWISPPFPFLKGRLHWFDEVGIYFLVSYSTSVISFYFCLCFMCMLLYIYESTLSLQIVKFAFLTL